MTFKYEEARDRLAKIVQDMESGDLTIEEMIDKYEEGMDLYKDLAKKLDDFQDRVKVLQENEEGEDELRDLE